MKKINNIVADSTKVIFDFFEKSKIKKNKLEHHDKYKVTNQIIEIPIDDIQPDEKIKSIWEQKQKKVEMISLSIMKNGYDYSQPITVSTTGLIKEGNSRLLAAKMAGLTTIPCVIKDFSTQTESEKYAIEIQATKRQLDESEVFKLFMTYEELRNKAKKEGTSTMEYSNEALAEVLNVCEHQITKMRNVLKAPELVEQVKNGKLSVNQAEILLKKNQSEKEKTQKNKLSKKDYFSLGIKYTLHAIGSGKTSLEILDDNSLSDIFKNHKIVLSENDLSFITDIMSK